MEKRWNECSRNRWPRRTWPRIMSRSLGEPWMSTPRRSQLWRRLCSMWWPKRVLAEPEQERDPGARRGIYRQRTIYDGGERRQRLRARWSTSRASLRPGAMWGRSCSERRLWRSSRACATSCRRSAQNASSTCRAPRPTTPDQSLPQLPLRPRQRLRHLQANGCGAQGKERRNQGPERRPEAGADSGTTGFVGGSRKALGRSASGACRSTQYLHTTWREVFVRAPRAHSGHGLQKVAGCSASTTTDDSALSERSERGAKRQATGGKPPIGMEDTPLSTRSWRTRRARQGFIIWTWYCRSPG